MNPKLQKMQYALRRLHILRCVEWLRYWNIRRRNWKKNIEFRKKYPNFDLPPQYLVFDAHGTIDWESYMSNGSKLAEKISIELGRLMTQDKIQMVLEWGCGPGRVIRHLPKFLENARIFGTDYNAESIDWCNKYLPSVKFVKNELKPPLTFPENSFDFIYAISVFTHLSEEVCIQWIHELSRVLKPNGILMVWTNGDYISNFLLPKEKQKYLLREFVFRDQYEEGKKMFLSFHHPEWVRNKLLVGYDILEHYSGGFSGTEQDVWIARIHK
jgi:ubiquinone/menaquinone biosynthesis C-methylase UbiE